MRAGKVSWDWSKYSRDPAKPGVGLVKVGLSVEALGKASWTFSRDIKNRPSETSQYFTTTPISCTLLLSTLLLVDRAWPSTVSSISYPANSR